MLINEHRTLFILFFCIYLFILIVIKAKIKVVKKEKIAYTRAGLVISALRKRVPATKIARAVFCKPTSMPMVVACTPEILDFKAMK